jgi:hypothetical protein
LSKGTRTPNVIFIQFQGLLIDLKADPTIQRELVEGIKQMVRHKNNKNEGDPDNQPKRLNHPASQQQKTVGWIHFFRGFLSQRWQEQQARYEAGQDTDEETNKNAR